MALWNLQGFNLQTRKPPIHSLSKADLLRMHRGYGNWHDVSNSPAPLSLIVKTLVAE